MGSSLGPTLTDMISDTIDQKVTDDVLKSLFTGIRFPTSQFYQVNDNLPLLSIVNFFYPNLSASHDDVKDNRLSL